MMFAVECGPWDRMVAHLMLTVVAELGMDAAAARCLGAPSFRQDVADAIVMFVGNPGGGSLVVDVDGLVVDVQVPALFLPVVVQLDRWPIMLSALFLAVVDALPSEAAAAEMMGMPREKMATFIRLSRMLVR